MEIQNIQNMSRHEAYQIEFLSILISHIYVPDVMIMHANEWYRVMVFDYQAICEIQKKASSGANRLILDVSASPPYLSSLALHHSMPHLLLDFSHSFSCHCHIKLTSNYHSADWPVMSSVFVLFLTDNVIYNIPL